MDYKKYNSHKTRIYHWVSFPFIWIVLIPLLILDIFLEIYHRVCFPLYGLQIIERSKYIRLDRYKLPYLKFYDRIFCLYCEYANGLILYAQKIASTTEKYWCGIKHNSVDGYSSPEYQKQMKFMDYGDKKTYEKLCKLQNK